MAPPRRQPADDGRPGAKRSGRPVPPGGTGRRREQAAPGSRARRPPVDDGARPGPARSGRPPPTGGAGRRRDDTTARPAGRRRDDTTAGPSRGRGQARSDGPPERALPRTWGNVARRGARVVGRGPDQERTDPDVRDRGRPAAWQPEKWTSEPVPGGRAPTSRPKPKAAEASTTAAPRPRSRKVPKIISQEVAAGVEPSVAPRIERRLAQAADAFERDHLPDALRVLKPLSKEAPGVPAVRELTGLAFYATGQWMAATKELEAFRQLTGSVEQHPVLADSYRALKRYAKVTELWDELRDASPGAALVTEGRIVAAGALADQGDVRGAIRLLERGPVRPSGRAGIHHARLWYALADLYERAGDAPKARELFSRVVAVEPGLADAAERLASLV